MKISDVIFTVLNFSISSSLCFSQIRTDCGNFISTQIIDSCSKTKIIYLGSSSSKKHYRNYDIPKEIFELKELEEIYINNLPVKQIPTEIAKLKKLKILFINHSNLSTFPFEFSTLDSITSLYIINGKLNTIPKPIIKLKNLRSLSIQGNNNLSYDSLGYNLLNTKITEICLGNKRFKKLDSSFVNLQSLEYIRICYGNQIDYYSLVQTLNSLNNLKCIEFNNCSFTKSEVKFLERIRPKVKLQFVNCKIPINTINELRELLKNTNDVNIGNGYMPKGFGTF